MHKIKLWQIINNEMQGMKENIAAKDDLAKTNQSIVRLKDKMDINHKALYDEYKLTYEKLTTLKKSLMKLTAKLKNKMLR